MKINRPILATVWWCLFYAGAAAGQADSLRIMSGKVLDAETGRPVRAMVSFEKIPGRDHVDLLHSDSLSGDYLLPLYKGSRYKIALHARGYITASMLLDWTNQADTARLKLDFNLVPIRIGQLIRADNVTFERGKYNLLPESYPALDNVYQMLAEYPNMRISLEGHTDNMGSPKANLNLSKNRVQQVKDYLVSKGISPKRISIKAFGGRQPLVPNNTEENREKNRRVEIRILRN